MAEEFSKKYADQGFIYLPGNIQKMVDVCRNGTDLPEDSPKEDYEIIEAICGLLEQSKQWESAHATPETPVEPCLVEEEGEITLIAEPTPTTNELVWRAATETRLDNGGYTKLTEVFTFDETFTHIRLKEGAIETPEHAGMLMGLGNDLGRKGVWLCIQGAQRLLACGLSDAMEQACASLKLSPQSIYNYCGSLPYATPEVRKELHPTVLVEICRARYSKDEKENDQKKKELVERAITHGWNCSEARSHVRMEKGLDGPVEGKPTLKEQLSELDREVVRLKGQVYEYPPLPITNSTRQDCIDGIRELYKEYLQLRRLTENVVGLPDYERMMDYIDQHGLPPKGVELPCIPEPEQQAEAA